MKILIEVLIDEALEYFYSDEIHYALQKKSEEKLIKLYIYVYHLIWYKLHIKNQHLITYFLKVAYTLILKNKYFHSFFSFHVKFQ